jgi:hypothetical protein
VFGLITTIIEILGAILIAVGIGIILGIGAACIASGVLLIAGSYFVTSEGAIE